MGHIIQSVFLICACFVYIVPTSVQAVFVQSSNNHPSRLTFQKGGSVDREGRKCHDFCTIIPDWCRNGGTCLTDETTCIGSCICSPSWTGQRCDSKRAVHPSSLPAVIVGPTNDSKLANLSGREAHQEKGIQNNSNDTIFSNNVVAMLHDIEDTDSNRGLIKEENTETSITMEPENQLELSGGIVKLTEVSLTTLSSVHDFSFKECTRSCIKGDCIKINDVYKCKHRIDSSTSTVEKACGPGFVCVHGVCDVEAKERNSYDCICERNYVGQFCDHECPFDCGQHGFCDYDVSIKLFKCFCQWNYTGYNCSQLIPTETELMSPGRRVSFHWYVLGASLTLVVLILAGSLLAGYFLWKKRLVFVLKIVHFFKEYEDEDGKEFDAFVSYRSTERDEKFVLTELFPRLEGSSKFKLCLHFRDFEPGEAIANNIVRAIENSRRTIMILSPAYVKSEWCRLEYQKAQHEMLKLKHRIIPIVLEDIGEVYKDLDTNLKSILNSVTYLEWPGPGESDKKVERFWRKLELSLPKKSSTSSSGLPTSSSSSSSESSESSSTSSDPLSDTSITSPSKSAHINSSKPALTLSIPTATTTCPDKSSNITKSSPKTYQRRRKNFRHFIDRFVRNSLQFNRQDSNSSQLVLVDEETTGSRSSCDSASESNLTESTESICSTPATALTYLEETISELGESRSYFSIGLKGHGVEGEKRGALCNAYQYGDANCITCLSIAKNQVHGETPQTDICSGNHVEGGVCEMCKLERERSDNNQVKISAIEGTDQIRIQRLPGVSEYSRCNHGFQRTLSCRGNLKNRTDAMNGELSMLNRAGTLPRSFRSKILAKRENKLGDGVTVDDNIRATTYQSDSVSDITGPEVDVNRELNEPSNDLESIKSDKTFSSNGYSYVESEDNYNTYNGLISIESGDSFSNDGSLC